MPIILGRQRASTSSGLSEDLGRLLATRHVENRRQWQTVFAELAAGRHLALLAPWRQSAVCLPGERQAIETALIANTARNQLFLRALATVMEELTAQGIPVRLLKGVAAIQDCYDELGERMLGDLDLLVPKAQLPTAAGVLMALGYEPLLPELQRDSLHDPHLLRPAPTGHGAVHHHWPPLVGPSGVVVELHWTLGDGFTGDAEALWVAETPLMTGRALVWADRLYQALVLVAIGADPRAFTDALGLLAVQPVDGLMQMHDRLRQPARVYPVAAGLGRLASLGSDQAAVLLQALALPAVLPPIPPSYQALWRRRLSLLRSRAHLRVFVSLGWQACRFPRQLRQLPLPEVARALVQQPFAQGTVTVDEVVTMAGWWTQRRWINRPSYCLQRSALLFAGLTAIGEPVSLSFGLDPDALNPIGHAWVERDAMPFLEDAALIARMIPTYRYDAGTAGL